MNGLSDTTEPPWRPPTSVASARITQWQVRAEWARGRTSSRRMTRMPHTPILDNCGS
ncbi:hypothetical protein Pd630_LPD10041 (plasmid) [Rhodococcus opacus PD630]|nr:hypothetical protein Pd630_LPD10041 [Rhodococcus opacus PD630]